MKNVFSSIGLVTYENIVVRYYCRGIVKGQLIKIFTKRGRKSNYASVSVSDGNYAGMPSSF